MCELNRRVYQPSGSILWGLSMAFLLVFTFNLLMFFSALRLRGIGLENNFFPHSERIWDNCSLNTNKKSRETNNCRGNMCTYVNETVLFPDCKGFFMFALRCDKHENAERRRASRPPVLSSLPLHSSVHQCQTRASVWCALKQCGDVTVCLKPAAHYNTPPITPPCHTHGATKRWFRIPCFSSAANTQT